jgi:nucleotide-binding universal stress UspA family protein
LSACAYALSLFPDEAHRFTLLHSYIDPLPGYAGMVDMSSSAYAASVEGMLSFVARVRELPGADRQVPATHIEAGPLASALKKFCLTRRVDLIIMGTQGTGGHLLFGSNAGAVATTSRTPVLVVPQEACFQGWRRILLADDGLGVDTRAMALLLQLAMAQRSEVIIAHVLRDEGERPDPAVIAAYDQLFAHVPHRYTDAAGEDIALALSMLAERDRADVVVALHRHSSFLAGLLHGSISKRLAMHSHVPLLVLEH